MRIILIIIAAGFFAAPGSIAQTEFTEHVITTDADGATSVFAIDLDKDEDIDVVSASSVDDKISWFENTGEP